MVGRGQSRYKNGFETKVTIIDVIFKRKYIYMDLSPDVGGN